MNSFSAGCAKRSSHNEGFTPVSHWSNATSLASCQAGVSRCTSFPSSSKQKRKNRCGYQCRQKCQNFIEPPTPCLSACFATRASTRHKTKIIAATNACTPINFAGCARCSAKTAISALDVAKYPSATHSNAPHAAPAAVASRTIHAAIPIVPRSILGALSSAPAVPTSARHASAASFPRYCCRCTSFIQGSPVLLFASGDRGSLLFLLCEVCVHGAFPDLLATSLRYILVFFPT